MPAYMSLDPKKGGVAMFMALRSPGWVPVITGDEYCKVRSDVSVPRVCVDAGVAVSLF